MVSNEMLGNPIIQSQPPQKSGVFFILFFISRLTYTGLKLQSAVSLGKTMCVWLQTAAFSPVGPFKERMVCSVDGD